jgi:toxin ParE1/3/4
MRVIWSPLALRRVEEIARVIAADRPAAADRWVVALFDRVKQLQAHPKSGPMVPELGRAEIRQLVYSRYRIIYRLDPRRVVILTVRHGRQEFDAGEVNVDST